MVVNQAVAAAAGKEVLIPSAYQSAASGRERRDGKFLTFFLAGEEYGIEILKVQEIISMMSITTVPCTPHYVRGVINLRGKVITVVDLRLKFGMEFSAQTEETCIIVVQTRGVQIGCVVDKVSEVLDINSNDIDDTPSFGVDVDTDLFLGIGKTAGRVRLLLDIDKVLSRSELTNLPAPDRGQEAAEVDQAQ